MLQSLLGPETTWSLQCALVDAVLKLGAQLQRPSPAIKFSGSRGIHVYWLIEQGAVGSEWIEIEPYRETAFKIDKYIVKKKTTESLLRPFIGLKMFECTNIRTDPSSSRNRNPRTAHYCRTVGGQVHHQIRCRHHLSSKGCVQNSTISSF